MRSILILLYFLPLALSGAGEPGVHTFAIDNIAREFSRHRLRMAKAMGLNFLDTRDWGIGPQQTLSVAGPWRKKGRNELFVVDLLQKSTDVVRSLSTPILDEPGR